MKRGRSPSGLDIKKFLNPMLVIKQRRAYADISYLIKWKFLPNLKERHIRCRICRKRATEYHHQDYSKPQDVIPVCRSCNVRLGHANGFILEKISKEDKMIDELAEILAYDGNDYDD